MLQRPGYARVKFSVTDEGVGITEENIQKLFTPFTQIDPKLHQAGQGTGIGLAICKETVELHGGVIGVKSTPHSSRSKGGSNFYFIIDFELPPPSPFSAEQVIKYLVAFVL